MTDPKILEAITLLIGGGALAVVTNFLISWFREKQAARLSSNQQPIDHYNDLVNRLEKRIDNLEIAHRECQDHHRVCERQVGELTGRVDELRRQVHLVMPQPRSGVNILMQGSGNPEAVIEESPERGPEDARR